MVAALMLSYTSIFSQNLRDDFRARLNESYKYIKSNPEKAVAMASDAYDMVKGTDDDYIKTIGFVGLGYVSYGIRDYESAYRNYTEALSRMESLDTVDLNAKVAVLKQLAMICSKFNNHEQSIEFRKQSWDVIKEYAEKFPEIMKEKKADRLLTDIPYFLASEYEKKGAHQTAGKLLMQLWEEAEDKKDIKTHARVLNKLGQIKKANGEFSEALNYFGLVASEPEASQKHRAIAYHNLGETYLAQGEWERAESNYLLALGLKEDLKNERSTFLTYMGLGELEYKKNDMQAAINHWEKGLSIFDKVEGEPELYDVYNWLQLAYMDIDVQKAKTFNQEFHKLNNFYVRNQTFQREEEAQRREALSALIDSEKQRRVDAQQRERFIQQFWPVFLGVGLLVLFSIILGVRYYVALRANRALSQSQLKLERAKEILKSADTDLD